MKKSKKYNDFWDNFNTKLYENVLETRKDVLQIRINKDVKNEFKKNCKDKGGMANVLNVFINQANEASK